MKRVPFKELPESTRRAIADAYAGQVDPNELIEVGEAPGTEALVVRLIRGMSNSRMSVKEQVETMHAIFGVDAPKTKVGTLAATSEIIARIRK